MEFKEIDYILTIAECGSLSKAADKLLMTQPSLSQFLQQFEAQLGCQLFLRTTRGLSAHDPGRGAHRGRKGFYR